MEARQSDGNGLLADDGPAGPTSSPVMPRISMLTMSTVMKRRGKIGQDYAAYFARPYGVIKTFIHTIAEIVRERRDNRRQERTGIEPKIERSRVYAIMRAWATVIQLDLQISGVVGDILAGRPSIYIDLRLRRGSPPPGSSVPNPSPPLAKVDREIDRIRRVVAEAPRPYHLVVPRTTASLRGATFQRYGVTLEEVVEKATGKEAIGPARKANRTPAPTSRPVPRRRATRTVRSAAPPPRWQAGPEPRRPGLEGDRMKSPEVKESTRSRNCR